MLKRSRKYEAQKVFTVTNLDGPGAERVKSESTTTIAPGIDSEVESFYDRLVDDFRGNHHNQDKRGQEKEDDFGG